jgi:hypothetical protein
MAGRRRKLELQGESGERQVEPRCLSSTLTPDILKKRREMFKYTDFWTIYRRLQRRRTCHASNCE